MKVARGFLPFLITLAFGYRRRPAAAESHASLGVNFSLVGLDRDRDQHAGFCSGTTCCSGSSRVSASASRGEAGMDDFYFDTGFVVLESSSLWSLTVNYQRNLAHSATAPYLTVGGGFRTESTGGGGGDTGTLVGGLRRDSPSGRRPRHAAPRAASDVLDDPNLSSTLKSFGVKAGFDVWVR